jgi:hypothetical protein
MVATNFMLRSSTPSIVYIFNRNKINSLAAAILFLCNAFERLSI